ncbi:MAG: hypothetical protein VX374_10590, partial [Pseudomonadota bacterium]|nr:hypothetical protein [Pseudomonadota bacterium]
MTLKGFDMRFLIEFATARLALAPVLALLVPLMLPAGASAQSVTPDQIINALLPDAGAPKSRSMRKQEP